MLGRLIRKAVIAASVLLAIALTFVAIRSRERGLLIGGARNGTYAEVRAADGDFSVTTFAPWVADSPTRAGRAPPAPVGLHDFGNSPTRHRIMLLDGTSVLMDEAPLKWWPPLQRSGNAYPQRYYRGGMQIAGGTLIATTRFSVPRPPSAGWIVTGNGTLTVNPSVPLANAPATRSSSSFSAYGPTTFPSGTTTITLSGGGLTLQRGAVTATTRPAAGDMLATLKDFGDFGLSTKPPPATAPAPSMTIVGNSFTYTARVATATYERYALPQWLVIGMVLAPVWLAALATLLRWRRRIVRRRSGLCEACGYDLRGNASGACPECGTIPWTPPANDNVQQPMGDQLIARLR
jgi:hypothetical protein